MKAKFYSVGVGPGDPKLITYKAVETIQACDVIALPRSGAAENAVLKIAAAHIKNKPTLFCDMPMIRNQAALEKHHNQAAADIAAYLDAGKNVAFLTLGDPAVYASCMYIHSRLQNKGYDTEMISGVPSFCAAAAALNIPLCEGGEMLHIIPASYENTADVLGLQGTKIFMKAGKQIPQVKNMLKTIKGRAMAVERCGMEQEIIHTTLDTVAEDASYFTVLVLKEGKQ